MFVLLDSVQFSRGSRTNRVQVLAGDRPTWLTVPVRRPEHGEPRIADALIDDSRPWRRKALRTLEVSYGSLAGLRGDLRAGGARSPSRATGSPAQRGARSRTLRRARAHRARSRARVRAGRQRRRLGAARPPGGRGRRHGLPERRGGGRLSRRAAVLRRGIEVRFQRFRHPTTRSAPPSPSTGCRSSMR